MFGSKETFSYFQCDSCDCLQIDTIPQNLQTYYPNNYYSMDQMDTLKKLIEPVINMLLAKRLCNYSYKPNIIGAILQKLLGPPHSVAWVKDLLQIINIQSKVLDVGCGYGKLISVLHWAGFTNLTGIDPFIGSDINYHERVRILKRDLYALDELFDFVMMHHSFEHMPDPHTVFKQLYKLTNPGGYLLIRIPVVPSFAWDEYGTDWVALDAPRHLFIHSMKSIRLLAEEAGLSLVDVKFDSTDFQFRGSEQYRRGIPLVDNHSYSQHLMRSIFTKREIKAFKEKACELNEQKMGDQACFYLRKPANV